MLKLITLFAVLILAGCAGNPDQDAKSLLDRIEFGPEETGCARITGQVSVGGNPFASSKLNLTVVKKKHTLIDSEGVRTTVEDVPDC